MKLIISFLLAFAFQSALAGIVGQTSLTGKVLKYDKKTVTLSHYGDKQVTVPRSAIKKSFKKMKTGMMVTAVFSTQEIMDKVQAQTKK